MQNQPHSEPVGPRYGDVTIRDRGRLPHWESEGAVYFFTIRLGDSLPAHVLDELREERELLLREAQEKGGKLPQAVVKDIAFAMSERAGFYLDQGYGACHLKDRRVAKTVHSSIQFLDGKRYRLHAWCIMPNHVHVIFRLMPEQKLEKLAHSLKSFTAKEANKVLGRRGTFWQREYYDHVIRSAEEYSRLVEYVLGNPAAAGLKDWPWIGRGLGKL